MRWCVLNLLVILNIQELELGKSRQGRLWGRCVCVWSAVFSHWLFQDRTNKAARFTVIAFSPSGPRVVHYVKIWRAWQGPAFIEDRKRTKKRTNEIAKNKLLVHCFLLFSSAILANGTVGWDDCTTDCSHRRPHCGWTMIRYVFLSQINTFKNCGYICAPYGSPKMCVTWWQACYFGNITD